MTVKIHMDVWKEIINLDCVNHILYKMPQHNTSCGTVGSLAYFQDI